MDTEQENILVGERGDAPEEVSPYKKDDHPNIDSSAPSEPDTSNNGTLPCDKGDGDHVHATSAAPSQPMEVDDESPTKPVHVTQSPVKVIATPTTSPIKNSPTACASPSSVGASSPSVTPSAKTPGTPSKMQESPSSLIVPEMASSPSPAKVIPTSTVTTPVPVPPEVEEQPVKEEPDLVLRDETPENEPERINEANESVDEEVVQPSSEGADEPMEVKEEDKPDVSTDNCDGHAAEPEPTPQPEAEQTPKAVILDKIAAIATGMENALALKEDEQVKGWLQRLNELRTYTDQKLDSSLFEAAKNQPGQAGPSKQGKRRSTKKEKAEVVDFLNFSLKEIKGLPVFAKWPHSGWFYPGVVRDMTIDNWKSSSNVTVMFYDGLERDMKSVHILPAELVPATAVLFDLDEEVDVTVMSSAREGDWVTFNLNSNDGDEAIERGFDKLAIKGASMKSIKLSVDSSAPDTPQENVSGKRSRGKSSLFTEDYVSSASRSKKLRNTKSSDDDSTEATPSRTASKRRQVNGSPTKPTPRRKGGKGK